MTFFIALAGAILGVLSNVLPASSTLPVPSQLTDALTYVGGAVNSLSYILPVASIFYALLLIVSYEAIMWGFHAIRWVWKLIPFIGK